MVQQSWVGKVEVQAIYLAPSLANCPYKTCTNIGNIWGCTIVRHHMIWHDVLPFHDLFCNIFSMIAILRRLWTSLKDTKNKIKQPSFFPRHRWRAS